MSKLLDIPKEHFAGLYEVPEKGQDEIPPGVIAALKTFSDALGVMKSNMWGGKNDDSDSDDRTDSYFKRYLTEDYRMCFYKRIMAQVLL